MKTIGVAKIFKSHARTMDHGRICARFGGSIRDGRGAHGEALRFDRVGNWSSGCVHPVRGGGDRTALI
jgi:hypothetical protein